MAQRSTSSTSSPSGTQVSQDKIAMRAYEKWCQRGCPHGTDQQDWYEAEREIRAESKPSGSGKAQR